MQIHDLHCHSTASDGTLSPTKLVQYAATKGIKILALTDHDTTAGIEEARIEAKKQNIQLINGAEISIVWQKTTVHIVALGFDSQNKMLLNGLDKIRTFRQQRAQRMSDKLAKEGIKGAYNAVLEMSKGGLITRPHFARFLIKGGYAKDMNHAFKNFITLGKPGYVQGEWATLEEVLEWIKDAKGQAIIAHPARYKMTRTKLIKLINDFKQQGGVGMEVVSGSHSKDDVFNMAALANKYQLLASVGSDFHGPEHQYIDMGRCVDFPPECKAIWSNWH